jgi:hypothetical protein
VPQEGQPVYLAYKLIDPNNNAVVVSDLFHLNNGEWTVRALLPGYPGSTTLGEFSISLPPPYSDDFAKYKYQYNAIFNSTNRGIGLKVEAYLNDVDNGLPVMTGVITKMSLPLDGPWVLHGVDTLWWLQQSQMMPSEIFGAPISGVLPTTGLEIITALKCTQETVWADDFHNWNGVSSPGNLASTDYNIVSGWSFVSSDPYTNQPALVSTSIGEAVAVTNTGWSYNNQYAFAMISIHGTLEGTQIGTGPGSVAGIYLLSDSNAQNTLLSQIIMTPLFPVGPPFYQVDWQFYDRVGGTYNLEQTATVFSTVGSPFPFELTAIFFQGANEFLIGSFVNGKNVGIYIQTLGPASTINSGRIGIRHTSNTGGGGPACYVNRIEFKARTRGPAASWSPDRFAFGTTAAGGGKLPITLSVSGQTHLDMILLAASLDGFQIRKNPGAGHKADSLDYVASPGVDRSNQILLEENINIIAQGSSLSNVAEVYATDAKVNSIPGGDSGGSVTWGKIGSIGDMVLIDTVTDVGIIGYSLLTSYATAIQSRKGAPIVATQLTVIRTADLLNVNAGWGPRELDFVTIHLPTFNIIRQKAQIVGYKVTEGSSEITYYLVQFPEAKLAQATLQRLLRTSDYLSNTYQAR